MREAFQYKYLIALHCLTNLRLYHFYLDRGEVRPPPALYSQAVLNVFCFLSIMLICFFRANQLAGRFFMPRLETPHLRRVKLFIPATSL